MKAKTRHWKEGPAVTPSLPTRWCGNCYPPFLRHHKLHQEIPSASVTSGCSDFNYYESRTKPGTGRRNQLLHLPCQHDGVEISASLPPTPPAASGNSERLCNKRLVAAGRLE
ncbi:hypothetical protein CEXT_612121 [Caerostris extrusa]|uniref:Uncharacterized protein n=1 Tax=Caerostris extrusa TaxID=172846 RepID=A0AAV4MSP5_CAEEX|nr:hypothetical protein CEXT_612121 [Caerostris extrusa]